MDDLITRLTAALDEIERCAHAACHGTRGEWTHTDPERHPGGVDDDAGDIVVYDEGSPTQEQAAHIARHDPASVLRGCAADRKTLAAVQRGIDGHPEACEYTSPGREEWQCAVCVEWNKTTLDPYVLTFVAERYACVLEVDSG